MTCEVTVKVKDKLRSITQKTPIIESISAHMNDPKIDELVSCAVKMFSGQPEKITVIIKLEE